MRPAGKARKQRMPAPVFVRFALLALFLFASLSAMELLLMRRCSVQFSQKTFAVFAAHAGAAFFVALLCALLPRLAAAALLFAAVLAWALAFAVQVCYHGVFSSFASLDALLRGTEALTNFGQIVAMTVGNNRYALLAMLAAVLLSAVCAAFVALRPSRLSRWGVCASVLACAAVKILCVFAVCATAGAHNSPYQIYTQKIQTDETIRAAGVLRSFALDAERRRVAPDKTLAARTLRLCAKALRKLPPPQEALPGGAALAEASALSAAQAELSATEDKAEKYNVLPIDFDALLADGADEETHALDLYFRSIEPDEKNEYTGLFAGKNLIYITAESFSPYAAREDITPTLYKMLNEGFHFTHFYNPYWAISTTDGEYVNCTSLVPKQDTYSFKDSAKNWLPFALGNQFRALGYTTKAYHNYLGSYYDRNVTHPNLGYDFYSMGEGYRKTEQWPDSDLEMMQLTCGDYMDCEPFHVYYMTISGHLPYDFYANAMAIKNKALVEDLPFDEAIKAFYACNIELDRALQFLLEELERRGIAENTVIALAADHWPYGLEPKQLRQISGKKLEITFELYESGLIIYNPGQKTVEVDKICCNMDIVPTLSNLFGLRYDSRLLMGHDVFSAAKPFVIFKCINAVTEKLKYNGSTGTALYHDGTAASEADLAEVKRIMAEKIKYSALVLDKDYYRRVFPPEEEAAIE